MTTGATILVTGANRGIGLELTRQLTARGDRVIAGCRHPEGATALADLAGVERVPLDVADPASVAALGQRLQTRALDGLINCAGVFLDKGSRIEDAPLDFESFEETFAINTAGPLRVLEAVLPALRKGSARKVITVSSQMGSIARSPGGSYWYRASKAAVNALMANVAMDLKADGFVLVQVHPGWVRTDMGGAGAEIGSEDSAAGILALMDRMTPEMTGRFMTYEGIDHPV